MRKFLHSIYCAKDLKKPFATNPLVHSEHYGFAAKINLEENIMRVLNGFEVEQNPTKSCYKISGKDVPSDLEIRIRFENGKYKAEANYSKKPSSTATSTWQPRSLPFDSEEKALENILNYFASNNEPFVKD